MDTIDILIKLGIFASFVVFGVTVWLGKKTVINKKSKRRGNR